MGIKRQWPRNNGLLSKNASDWSSSNTVYAIVLPCTILQKAQLVFVFEDALGLICGIVKVKWHRLD